MPSLSSVPSSLNGDSDRAAPQGCGGTRGGDMGEVCGRRGGRKAMAGRARLSTHGVPHSGVSFLPVDMQLGEWGERKAFRLTHSPK